MSGPGPGKIRAKQCIRSETRTRLIDTQHLKKYNKLSERQSLAAATWLH